MKKIILIATLTIYSQIVFGQIKVPNVGDGWKPKVEAALEVIKTYDCEKYTELLNVCTQIEYWNGTFATTDVNSIIIPTSELKAGFINDIAAIIVHESLHLYFQKHNVKLTPRDEERLCYLYELEFLLKIPNVEPWLIEHAKKQIKLYSNE
jgi:hypothetical protein